MCDYSRPFLIWGQKCLGVHRDTLYCKITHEAEFTKQAFWSVAVAALLRGTQAFFGSNSAVSTDFIVLQQTRSVCNYCVSQRRAADALHTARLHWRITRFVRVSATVPRILIGYGLKYGELKFKTVIVLLE